MYQVEGYDFEDQEVAEKAITEAEGIKYIKERTRMDDPDMVLSLYNHMIDDMMFETPVGIGFLYELQEYLHTIPYVKNEDIRPIPIAISTIDNTKQKGKAAKREKAQVSEKSSKRDKKDRGSEEKETSKKRNSKKASTKMDENLDASAKKYKGYFHVSLFFTAVFAAIIVGMFAITYMSGNSVTILNYENTIIDKYESWEEELNEREEQLNKRAKALGLQDTKGTEQN